MGNVDSRTSKDPPHPPKSGLLMEGLVLRPRCTVEGYRLVSWPLQSYLKQKVKEEKLYTCLYFIHFVPFMLLYAVV